MDETEAYLQELNGKAIAMEKILQTITSSTEAGERLQDDWLSTSKERHKVRLQLEELKLMYENRKVVPYLVALDSVNW